MAVEMFLKMPKISGESVVKGHEKEIDVLGWKWGVTNTAHIQQGGEHGGGKANVQDLIITKYVDSASPSLFKYCCNATEETGDVVFTVRKQAGEESIDYVKITMTKVVVNSISTGGKGEDDRLKEDVTLNFAKVKFEYQPKTAGKAGAVAEMEFDIAANA